jgi:hypothetical protein
MNREGGYQMPVNTGLMYLNQLSQTAYSQKANSTYRTYPPNANQQFSSRHQPSVSHTTNQSIQSSGFS